MVCFYIKGTNTMYKIMICNNNESNVYAVKVR